MARKSARDDNQEAINAYSTGATKKTFHIKDLKHITAQTQGQKDAFHIWNEKDHLIMHGSAGTGKTFLSLFMGLREVLDENTPQDKVVIVRSIVPTRELGHLPGELAEKIAPYEEPYRAICSELFPYAKSYDNLKKNGYVSFEPTSFLRGKTFNNSIVIFDECQNANSIELYTVLSRIGINTRVIVAGDFRQADLNKGNDKSAFKDWLPMLQSIRSMGDVQFLPQDIVRSGFVRELIMAKEEFGL